MKAFLERFKLHKLMQLHRKSIFLLQQTVLRLRNTCPNKSCLKWKFIDVKVLFNHKEMIRMQRTAWADRANLNIYLLQNMNSNRFNKTWSKFISSAIGAMDEGNWLGGIFEIDLRLKNFLSVVFYTVKSLWISHALVIILLKILLKMWR